MNTVVLFILIVLAPAVAFGQPAIAGTVFDSSGAPLPSVTIEARSPELIEQVRTTITDADGRYRIENLRAGTYTVRFALDGWRAYQQEQVELTGSLTATVNASLALGSMSDTITVNGNTQVIDVHRSTREVTLSGNLIGSIPTTRGYNALVGLIPGIVTSTNDIVTDTATTSFPIHGGRNNEGRLLIDGLMVGSPPSGNSPTSYVVDAAQAREVTFTTAGALGETETGGLVLNIVPRNGGNTRRGSLFASGTGTRLQSDNLTADLKAQVMSRRPLAKVYDVTGTIGGPLVRDRVWFAVTAHRGGSTRESSNVYYNRNAGNPAEWRYVPDLTRLSYSDRTFENASGRVTWQATPRNTFTAFWDVQELCRTCTGATPGQSEPARVSPEAVGVLGRRLDVSQATWSSPATNRLFLEAGFGVTSFGVGNFERDPNPTRALVRIVEQCAAGCADNGNIPGLVYRSQDFSDAHARSYVWRASIAYVGSSHSAKAGYQGSRMADERTWLTNDQNLTYRVSNGKPNQLTQSISPWVNDARAGWDALFVQDQWTHRRLTLHGAVRFDRAGSWFPEQQVGPSRFLPAPIVIPATRGVDSYTDISPRIGVAYDASGHGRTAIKMTFGKYLEGAGVSGHYANANPTLRMPRTTSVFGTAGVTRAWTDANGDFVPDCDLLNPAAQDARAIGGDLCGVLSDANFGKNVLTNNFDRRVLEGWGVRPSDWKLAVSIQQQLGRRASIDVMYTRRWYRNFSVVDNLSLLPADLTPYSIVAPEDSRLPGGGGYIVSGLYDVIPEKAGHVDNLVTDAARFGEWYQYFNGVDVTANIRAGRLTLIGGTSTGQTVADNCDVRDRLPELATTAIGTSTFGAGLLASAVTPVSPYCHVAYGVLTQVRGLASYVVPKADVQLSVTFQSKPGASLGALYAAPNAVVSPRLGRDLSGNAPNVTVNLVPPGTISGDRVNQLDIRLAKPVAVGRSRTSLALEIYNALNSSAVLTYNQTFVPNGPWLQPLTVLTPRFFKVTIDVEL